MKAYLIQDAIGNISDKLIIDAEIAWQRKMRRTPRAIFLLAACLVISLSLMLAVFNRINDPLTDKPNTTPPGSDHSGVVPPELSSNVLEVGDVYTNNCEEPPYYIKAKIDRVIDLNQEQIPICVSYGYLGDYESLISDPNLYSASEVRLFISGSTAEGHKYIELKRMSYEDFIEGEYFVGVEYDNKNDRFILTYPHEELMYISSSELKELLPQIKESMLDEKWLAFSMNFYNAKGEMIDGAFNSSFCYKVEQDKMEVFLTSYGNVILD